MNGKTILKRNTFSNLIAKRPINFKVQYKARFLRFRAWNCLWYLSLILINGKCLLAQENVCNSKTVERAWAYYDEGNFSHSLKLINGCLQAFRTDTIKFEAYRILSNTYIATDSFDLALTSIKEMLRFRPHFIPDTYASHTFKKMVAQAQKVRSNNNAFDNVVTSASSVQQLSSDAPASIYVITEKQINNRGYSFLLDLLTDIPEIEVQKNSIVEFKNQASFRGISGNEKFLIMVDGVRITPATGDFYTLGENFSLVNVRQVEVILGPASALYGVDAFSGIINILTKNGDQLENVNLTLSYESYNSFHSSFSAGSKQNHFSWVISGQYFITDEANYAEFYKDDYHWYHERYLPFGEVTFADGKSRNVQSDDKSRAFEMPTRSYFINGKVNFGDFEVGAILHGEKHSASVSVDPQFTLYSKDAFLASDFQEYYIRHLFKPPTDRWSLVSQVSSNNYMLSPKSKFINKFTNYEQGYKYQFSRSVKFEEQFQYEISPRSLFLIGLSFENSNALPKTADLPKQFDKNIPADNQDIIYSGTGTSTVGGDTNPIYQNFYELNYQNFGSFIQWLYDPNEHINITVGGRLDHNTRYGSTFNPRIGIVLKPQQKLKIKFLYGQSFLAPSPWKAYSHFGTFQKETAENGNEVLSSNFFHIPNPDLKPEKLKAFETSFFYYVNKNLALSANGYYNLITDLINFQVIIGEGHFQNIPVKTLEQAKNGGKARVYGGSLAAHFISDLSENIKIDTYLNYSFNNGRIGNQKLTLMAKHHFKAGIDVKFHRLNTSLRWRYQSQSFSVVRDESGSFIGNDPFGIVNFYVNYPFNLSDNLNMVLFSKIKNLTDKRHYHVGVGNDSFARTPQQPISFELGAKIIIR